MEQLRHVKTSVIILEKFDIFQYFFRKKDVEQLYKMHLKI
jgi:hypothetical protein